MQPFLPFGPKAAAALIEAAGRQKRMDEIDRQNGNPTPAECGLSELLRTAICAVGAGVEMRGWKEVTDGLVLLIQAEHLSRQLEGQVDIRVKTKGQR